MDKFMFAFHGGKIPESKEEGERIMAKWEAWTEGLGPVLTDPGSIVGKSSTVTPNGVRDDGGADPLSGYMIVTAADRQAAIEIAKSCPILENEGTIEVAPLMEI